MNSVIHSQISVRKRGGVIEDYLNIHDLMDSTKELCSDNRHRILHTMWGIKRVIVPIFGHTIINSDDKAVNVKDLCEQDHILPDYLNRFIPNLSDFAKAIDDSAIADIDFVNFAKVYEDDKELMELLLSPLGVTGLKKSLLITHNSWFINEIVPRVLKRSPEIRNFEISPADLFNNMHYKLWMDNGSAFPESCKFTLGKIVG
ncbi:DUF6915 family protein [Flavobacterium collinsii]|uniref:DUF6915 domain-containing protein n=1 Tax=Flavobacterium collinsii TaxID=1114861 RepID=A0A9W4TFU2_9FLAO|nr:hypothetical protein [Flavobacterium collinsii]CAI2765986.1 conserved protein of unknown function [Flavobacterium collinsii]